MILLCLDRSRIKQSRGVTIMMNYTKENISKLDFYFTSLVKANDREHYYINAMNNQDQSIDKYHKDAFVRDAHNYCNWTFIAYSDLNKGLKQYDDRRWFYVTESASPEYVQIRKDLVDAWSKNNAKDTVLVVVPNGVIAIPMQNFFGKSPISFKIEWNDDGNVIYRYDISRQPVIGNETYEATEETVEWYSKSAQYIGHCSYAEHRTSKKTLIVARYNSDNTRKCFHKMKSIKQAYDLLGVAEKMDISYKTFQRLINKNTVGYFIEIGNIKFWIKVEDPASNVIPETWGTETVEVSEESVEAISVNVPENVSDDTEELEMAIETTVNKVQKALPEIIKDNTDPVLGKPDRIIIRVDTQVVSEHSDEEWCNLVNKMEQKRTIIR